MARDSERVQVDAEMSRIEVADLVHPTEQIAPLFGEGTSDEPLVIEEHVPTPSGEHPALVTRDSLPDLEIVDLRMSGMQPIDDRESGPMPPRYGGPVESAPIAIETLAGDATVKNHSSGTSLGVAPLEPATTVRAPFVNDTPVQRSSRLPRPPAQGSTRIPTQNGEEENRHERTAMIALDPRSGMPRSGPWQALVAVARSLGSVRWWLRRRKPSRVSPDER